MKTLSIFRMAFDGPLLIGRIELLPISFSYDASYLSNPSAHPLSHSLPLQENPFSEDELIAYFDGLLPEGEARRKAVAELNIEPDNYLMLLYRLGLETIGDIAVTDGRTPLAACEYRKLDDADLRAMFSTLSGIAESNSEARLSLAGTQGKTGLAHDPGEPIDKGWFQPLAGAPSTHILKVGSLPDVPYIEYLCMKAAGACGIIVPEATLLDFGKTVFCTTRYDRNQKPCQAGMHIERLHQEDLAQALGIAPSAKYRELNPSSYSVVSEFLRSRSFRPIEDIEALARIACFNYLIGNCDNHLKNLSIMYGPDWKNFRLAPAYDLVSTTRFERFSHTMGMRIGRASSIDEVTPSDFLELASILGIDRQDFIEIIRAIVEAAPAAIAEAGCSLPHFEALPFVADDLLEDMATRLSVLESV